MILNFLLCVCIWGMIYCAHRACPIFQGLGDKELIEIRDQVACNEIIVRDDILSPQDLTLFMQVLRALDFLHYTMVPALCTWIGLYILRNLYS